MNYYEHHLGDYAKDTAHLSMLEHGAYRLLLDRYYSTEAGIPADQAHRVSRARTKEEKQAVDVVLDEFFQLVDGIWINKRADEEIIKAQAKISAAKENGKKGGRPKKNRPGFETETQSKPSGLSVGSETETQSKAHQSPVTSLLKTNDQSFVSTPQAEPPATAENETRTGSLCKQLRAFGIDAAPHLAGWAEILPAFSDTEILAAAQKARDSKPGERIHLNYLLPMLKDRATPKPAAQREAPWWSSNDRMIAKGAQLGLEPRPGEDWPQFRGRIDAKLVEQAAA